jgi:hypothetical protein
MIRRYTGRYAGTVPLGKSPIMTWPDFIARVEEQTQLDDSAKILDIDVVQPQLDSELDLCVLAKRRHRTVWKQISFDNPDADRG